MVDLQEILLSCIVCTKGYIYWTIYTGLQTFLGTCAHQKRCFDKTKKCLETWHFTCWITTTPAKSMSALDNEHNVLNMTTSVFVFTSNSECWTYANRNAADWYHPGDVFAWWMLASLFGTHWAQAADETIKSISLRDLPTGQLVCSLSIEKKCQTVQWAQALGCHGHTSHTELGFFFFSLFTWNSHANADSTCTACHPAWLGTKLISFGSRLRTPISKREI